MVQNTSINWEAENRVVHKVTSCSREYEWLEEFQTGPDGEKIAVPAKFGDGEFGVCVNGEPWENVFEKVWYLRYLPDGRLMALVQQDMLWSVALDGEPWPDYWDFVLNPMFSRHSDAVAVAIQSEMTYAVAKNGEPWETFFDNANNFVMSRGGESTAAVVQTKSFPAADIDAFQEGCFSVAIDGKVWGQNFLNCWTPVFDAKAEKVAAQIRLTLYDYTIAVDGRAWPEKYTGVWEPCFHPKSNLVVAPVRVGGKWGMAGDGRMIWPAKYVQVWQQQFSEDGSRLWAIVAPQYGRFTVAVDDRPWSSLFDVVTDLTVGPDGQKAAVTAKAGQKWTLVQDDRPWPGFYDRVWAPVFSPDGAHVGAKVERAGKYTIVVDGKPYAADFDTVWDPIFSPDGQMVMIRAISDGQYLRIVVPVSGF